MSEVLWSDSSLSDSLADGVESDWDADSEGVDSLDGDPSETELSLTSDDWWLDEDHESSTVEYDSLLDSDGVDSEAESDCESDSDCDSLDGEPSETELSLLSDGLPEDGVLLDEL
ncbi:hypothetical protein [Allorhodopirellula solitaria]|uniref:Uncharacterized protein n=1 Tax=Allorhodopirellula solitaria TaxID=2527987 RepID=A0A5C5YJ08_9BACT|nr:hypothetical protein [Allorhodopirellula solitaria]TWT74847.1 hypothetical protein CA85_01330 [Allorhodopirellula solitaria]